MNLAPSVALAWAACLIADCFLYLIAMTGLRKASSGLMLIAGLIGVVQTGAAGPPQAHLIITIHVYNHAEVDRQTLVQAEEVATGIFAKTGVESRWVEATWTSQDRHGSPTDHRLSDLSHLQLNIARPMTAERQGLSSDVMGLAPGAGSDRQLVYVFYKDIEAIAQLLAEFRVKGMLLRNADKSQILGHVMAHEIGHILLNLKSHTAGAWNLKDLQDASYGYLLFTPPQGAVIQAEVRRRVG